MIYTAYVAPHFKINNFHNLVQINNSDNLVAVRATATGVWLYPINANTHLGAAQNIIVRDVDNGRILTSATGYTANLAYYNDFGSMYGSHADYGNFTVSSAGNTYVQLNAHAVMDLNNRLRSPPLSSRKRKSTALDGHTSVHE